MTQCNCFEILESIKEYSKGKASSRFVLAIERCQDAIKTGSPKIAIKQWEEWFDDYSLRKLAKKTKKFVKK